MKIAVGLLLLLAYGVAGYYMYRWRLAVIELRANYVASCIRVGQPVKPSAPSLLVSPRFWAVVSIPALAYTAWVLS